jgi:hypothetical protein
MESVNSSSLGQPRNNTRAVQTPLVDVSAEIPRPVDDRDGFDARECRTDERVEKDLAATVDRMKLMLGQQGKEPTRADMVPDSLQMPGAPNFVQGDGSGTVMMDIAPEAVQFMRESNANLALNQGGRSGPTSSDMIPAFRGLSNLEVSFGSGSDVSMTAADSILGKRTTEGGDMPAQKLELSLGLGIGGQVRGKPKRGKKGVPAGQGDAKDDVADSVAARTRRKTASRHAAPRNLTGPHGGARQAQ